MELERYRKEILDFILSSPTGVVSLSAPTGAGKSLAVPNILAGAGYKTYVGVPTIITARSLAERQRQISKFQVGTAAESKIEYDSKSQIVYMTHGHMKNLMLARNKNLQNGWNPPDFLIVDESHTGSMDVSMIVGLYIYYSSILGDQVKFPRMILSSATAVVGNLSVLSGLTEEDIPYRFFGEIRAYPILIEYLNDSRTIKKLTPVIDLIVKKIQSLTNNTLIFVSGDKEGKDMERELKFRLKNITIYQVTGSTAGEIISEIANPQPTLKSRMVVITTNAMEAGITVPKTDLVIDTMEEKVPMNNDNGLEILLTTWVSQNSAIQRAGRTGRDMPGNVLRLVSKPQYDDLSPNREEEMLRLDISKEVIELIKSKIDPKQVFENLSDKIDRTIISLEENGMLKNGLITDAGSFANRVPLSLRGGHFLYQWLSNNKRSPFVGICVASTLDSYGPGSYYYIDTRAPETTKTVVENFGKVQFVGYLKAITKGYSDFKSLSPTVSQVNSYSNTYSLNAKKMREVYRLIERLTSILTHTHTIKVGLIDPQAAVLESIPILRHVYPTFKYDDKSLLYRSPTGESFDRRSEFPYDTRPELILVFSTISHSTSGSSDVRNYVSFSHPISEDQNVIRAKLSRTLGLNLIFFIFYLR